MTIAQASSGAVIITGVIAGSPAAAAGLKAGDLVEQIDGVPALQAVQDQKAEGWLWVAQCCSNPATDEHRLSEQFRSIARAKVGDRRLWTVQGRESPVETVATADDFLTWNLTAPSSPYRCRHRGRRSTSRSSATRPAGSPGTWTSSCASSRRSRPACRARLSDTRRCARSSGRASCRCARGPCPCRGSA